MTPGGSPPPPDTGPDDDLGPPATELRQLALPVDERFSRRVRTRIERRRLAGDLVALALTAPLTMMLEFLGMALELGTRRREP